MFPLEIVKYRRADEQQNRNVEMFYSRVERGTVSECNDPGRSAGPLD